MRGHEKRKNIIIAAVFVVIATAYLMLRYDFYFDLNDDVLMKDILSGAYTGKPDGHNIQMLYLLGAVISFFYRITNHIQWYGLFLIGCQFGSLFLIIKCILDVCDRIFGKEDKPEMITTSELMWDDNLGTSVPVTVKVKNIIEEVAVEKKDLYSLIKMLIAAVVIFFYISVTYSHLVFVQYTITVAFLVSAAIIYFMTSNMEEGFLSTLGTCIPMFMIVFAAFLLRSEMLLLLLPLICVAGMAKWGYEKKIFTKKNFGKYFGIFAIIALLLGIGYGTDRLAYIDPEWQEFRTLFDERTQLYDFLTIPSYEGNEAFYESIEINADEQKLLTNYNYGVSKHINAQTMGDIVRYAEAQNTEKKPLKVKLTESLKTYAYELSHFRGAGTDYPFNVFAIGLYIVLILSCVSNGIKSFPKILILLLVRTLIWVYMIMGGRMPERITHSLYLTEFSILIGMILNEYLLSSKREDKTKKTHIYSVIKLIPIVLVLLFGVYSLSSDALRTDNEFAKREAVNADYIKLNAYIKENKVGSRFYMIDVYSSVAYSEKMFVHVDNAIKNQDIMGGWACFSPLQDRKLSKCFRNHDDITMIDAFYNEKTMVVSDKEIPVEWIVDISKSLYGMDVTMELKDTVGERFNVYRIAR